MQDSLNNTASTVTVSLQNLWSRVAGFVPQLVAAIIIFIIGWIIASLLGSLVTRVLKMIKVDDLAQRAGADKLSTRIGKRISIAGIFGWLVKWFFLIATFVAAADALQLTQVSNFLYNEVFPYFGNVVIASIILVIGFLIANFLREIVADALRAANFAATNAVANIAYWAILIFAFISALAQLRIATSFMQDLFRAIVYMLALAGGLAFGLGGRDAAKMWLDSLSKSERRT
jgi:hypothetical protein